MSFRIAFIAILVMALVLMVRHTWVIRGSGFLVLSSALCFADAVAEVLGTQNWSAWAIFWILPIAVAMASRNVWIVSTNLITLALIVNDAGRTLWMPVRKNAAGFDFEAGTTHMTLRCQPVFSRWVILMFPSRPPNQKMDLLRKLLFKKFSPLFPRPKIRI
jgi:hypothetical protein